MGLIKHHITEKYLGNKDIKVTNSVGFCFYFVQKKYGDGPGKTMLKSKLLKLDKN